ncbi:unnamed protein product [Cyclocybe aegerita]|uniref:Uncharacterized protein n=1 Tax=Cyclocybe aegerita TaxID=1973307 RepID=A0A8S0W0L5_CYCAE|nr:unnamed protein product [Cyclocybe aegerita]
MSMPRPLIIELNRCFEPNAFNTGPSLTALIAAQKAKEAKAKLADDRPTPTQSSFSSVEEVLSEFDIPDLTASPASSTSTLSSLSLEDEEIRRIFSNPDPMYDALVEASPLLLDGNLSLDFLQRESLDITTLKKDELNPRAAPFVPSFTPPPTVHNPLNAPYISPIDLDNSDDMLIPPLDLELYASPSPQWCLVPQEDMQLVNYSTPLPVFSSPHIQSTTFAPLYPPGLPHPPHKALEVALQAEAVVPAALPPPVYLPLLMDALKVTTTPREREVLLGVIFDPNTCYVDWNFDSLLGLVEHLFIGTFGTEAEWLADQNTPAREPACYVTPGSSISSSEESPAMTSEEAFAEVAQELHKQLNEKLGEDYGKTFVWHLRETLLGKFLRAWDTTNPSAITFQSNLPSGYVHASLSLCKAIGAVFQRGILWREHVDLCLRALLKDLVSVEHVEALALIVLGCGKTFWDPPASLLIAPPPNASSTVPDTPTIASRPPSSPPRLEEMTGHARYALTTHVANFLDALEGSVVGRGINDAASVLGQPWGAAQLEARVQEIVSTVKSWEEAFLAMIQPAAEAA